MHGAIIDIRSVYEIADGEKFIKVVEKYKINLYYVNTLHRSQCDYNLFEAIKRQAAFYYSVSLPHFFEQKFLETALAR